MGGQLYTEKSNGFYGGSIAGRKPREIYAWIKENRGEVSVTLCCMELKVRREGYYAWEKRPTREERDAAVVSTVKQIRKEHPCYGVQSMIEGLPEEGKVSYDKGYRICRDYGLLTKRRKPTGITKAAPTSLASTALSSTVSRFGAVEGCAVHSDRGSQFTSHLYVPPNA